MRIATFVLAALALPAGSQAETPAKLHYVGEVKLSSATGQPIGSQVILLEKIYDRDASTITEAAIVVDPAGKVEERTMRLSVKPDNTFTLADEAKTVEGTGTLFGTAWRWTYFKGTWKSASGVTIDDENFMADDAVITARKKVTGPKNEVFMYMDMSLNRISPKTFEILRAGLLKN